MASYKACQVSIGYLLLLNLVFFAMVSSQQCPTDIVNQLANERACDPLLKDNFDAKIDSPSCCDVIKDLNDVVAATCLCTHGANILSDVTDDLDKIVPMLLIFNCGLGLDLLNDFKCPS